MDESLKTVERTSLDRQDLFREADKPRPKPKEGKSSFDELLEQSRQLSQKAGEPKQLAKTETRQALPETERQKDRGRDRSKDSEEKEEQKQEDRGERRSADGVHKKVVGKAGLKHQQGDGQGGQTRDGQAGSKKGDRSLVTLKKTPLSKDVLNLSSQHFAKEFQAQLNKVATHLPKTLPQDIINQVVRYCRVGKTLDGAKLFELECREALFQGLRLRIQSRHGKVSIAFLTAQASLRELLLKESPRLQQTLLNKGIAVETITVA